MTFKITTKTPSTAMTAVTTSTISTIPCTFYAFCMTFRAIKRTMTVPTRNTKKTSIINCTIIAVSIASQTPSTICTASSTATIATTSTTTNATITIRRTFRMIIKKIPQE